MILGGFQHKGCPSRGGEGRGGEGVAILLVASSDSNQSKAPTLTSHLDSLISWNEMKFTNLPVPNYSPVPVLYLTYLFVL